MSVLNGIRVLDFGRYIAGPYCATLLAEFGADVIRIEKCEGSEDRYVAPLTDEGEGALFLQLNRNKRSIALDPATEGGREIVRRLVATADIVIANMTHKAMRSLGIDYATLEKIKPEIILVSLSAFGASGPWKDRLGFDSIAQIMSGAVYLSGSEEQPYRSIAPWADFSTAVHAAFGTMVALRERDRSGHGQEVSSSLLANSFMINGMVLLEQAMLAPNRRAIGNRNFASSPTDIFRAKDGWLGTHVVGNELFARWAKLMGEEDKWLSDPRFTDDHLRGENGAILSDHMARWCAERTRDEALDALAEFRIPAGPVLSPQEVLDHPQIKAMGLQHRIDYPGLHASAPIPVAPVFLSRSPGEIREAPPSLGEHTNAILGELQYTATEIIELRRLGAI
jgi:crotonobetainyl-CoA:carnitine CoA-transferase CaiB-like acyl-CoA transferase